MAENTIERVIKIDTAGSDKTVRELTAEVEQARKKLEELQAGADGYAAAAKRAAAAEQQLRDAMDIAEDSNATRLATVRELAEAEARDAEEVNKVIDALTAYRDAGYDVSESLGGVITATEQANRTTLELDESVNKLRESGWELIDAMQRDQEELAAVQAQRKALNKEISQGLITEEQAREVKGELIAQESIYKARVSESRQALSAMTKEVVAAEGSYDQMSQVLGRLRDEYRQLSEAQRNSTVGEDLLGQIQSLDSELKNLDSSMGNYQRNVGNYGSILGDLGGTFTKVAGIATVAIGTVVTAYKALESVISSTKSTADAWNATVSYATTGWETFKQAIATGDFTNLDMRIAAAAEAAENLAWALAELGDQQRSLNIQEAAYSEELQRLNVVLRDATESQENREAAGQRIVEIEKKLADQQTEIYQEEYDKQADLLFARVNTVKYATEEERKVAQKAFIERVEQYVDLTEAQKQEVAAYQEASKELRILDGQRALAGAGLGSFLKKNGDKIAELEATIARTSPKVKDLANFMGQLGSLSDENLDQFAKSAINYYNSMGKADQVTRRVQTTLSNLSSQASKEAAKAAADAYNERIRAAKEAAEAMEKTVRDTLKIQQGLREKTLENELQTAKENYQQDLADFNKTVEEKNISEEVAAAYRKALAKQNEADIAAIREKYRKKAEAEAEKAMKEEAAKTKAAYKSADEDLQRDAARETAEAKRDITDPQELEQELSDIQQRLYDKRIELIDKMINSGELGEDAIAELSNQRADLEIKNIERVAAAQKKAREQEEKDAAEKRKRQQQILSSTSSFLDSMSQIVGEDTKAGKALAVSSALISTFLSAQQAYQAAFMPIPTPASPILGAINMAAAIASGLMNVKSILSVNENGTTSVPSAASTATPTVVTPPAVIEQVPLTRTLTSASEEERLNQMASPQRVYVVYDDIAQAGRNVQVQQAESTF